MTSAPWTAVGRLAGGALEDQSLGHGIARFADLEDLPEGVNLACTVVPRFRPSEAILCPRILVVDDNDDNRYTLVLYLELEGYADIQIAGDGEQAIGRLDKESFDLVLLDVMMPKVDGYQVLSWLKDRRRLHELPVIMISALNEMNSVVRCIELGAVDYLLKPFNQVLLKARLGASLEKKRLRDQVNAHLFRLWRSWRRPAICR
jgi:CheY-like chemotaxis protein